MDQICGGEQKKLNFRVIDNQAMEQHRETARTGMRARPDLVEKTFVIGNRVLPAAGSADGQEGCVTIPVFGVPIKLCWEFQDLTVNIPAVSLSMQLTAYVDQTQYLSAELTIRCDDIGNPAGCQIEVTRPGPDRGWLDPSCDWECLRRCSPGCLGCRTNYWCWAGCAVACVADCCSF